MRKILLNISIAALLLAQAAIAQDSSSAPATTAALSFGSSIYSSALARADVAVAKSVVTPSLLRGETGEAIRNQRVTGYMHRSGRWLDISPRLGPQGLDHVSVQLDENNVPARLMVDETKFGSARLLRTVRGDIQMGDRYLSDRLSGLAKRYRDIATQMRASMPTAKMPLDLSSRRIMVVPLSETESVQFWRSLTAPGEWYYDGPLEVRADAIRQLDRLALLHESAASGKIRYRRRIFQVKADGDAFTVTIRDAAKVDVVNGDLSRLPISGKILVAPAGAPTDSAVVEATLAAELKRQMPHLDFQEARQLASGVREVAASMEERLSRHSFTRYVAMESVKVGGVTMLLALPLETALTLLSGDSIDWSRTAGLAALGGASAMAGNTLGNTTSYALLRSASAHSATDSFAETLGMRSGTRIANLAGGTVGGSVAGILFAYGGYWLGYYDLPTANIAALAGFAGTGAGALASVAALELVTAYGVAGTGVAISSLSGVAATNASLALLGGGTLASGGLGVVGGTLVLYTGVGVVIVGVTGGVMYAIHLWDDHQDTIRLRMMLAYLSTRDSFITAPTP